MSKAFDEMEASYEAQASKQLQNDEEEESDGIGNFEMISTGTSIEALRK